jgi:hypothetical protein
MRQDRSSVRHTAVHQQRKIQENSKQIATLSTAGQTIEQISGCQGIYNELHYFATLPLTGK